MGEWHRHQANASREQKALPATQTNLASFWSCKTPGSLLRLGMCTPTYPCDSAIFGITFWSAQ